MRRAETARALGLAAAVCLWPVAAGAWGAVGHRLVVERAAAALPEPLAGFAAGQLGRLADRSLDPDLSWREECGREEAVRHFFDLDLHGGDPAAVARDLAHLRARHGERFVADAGLLPWRIEEMAGCLALAFERRDFDWASELMGQLAHYTADLTMPFHLTQDYDGVGAGQPGIHARYEVALVERNARRLALALARQPIEARPVEDPLEAAFAEMGDVPARVAEVLAGDRAAAAGSRLESGAYYRLLWRRLERRLAGDLAAASRVTAGIWLWAYERARRPPLPGERSGRGGAR